MSRGSGNQWSAPGSLLAAGEYLITEEGGAGLAVASGGRARLEIEEHPVLAMEGYNSGNPIPGSGLTDAVLRSYLEYRGRTDPPPCRLKVDTGAFFHRSGRKLGYGSSAAAAVLYSCGLHLAASPAYGRGRVNKSEVLRAALEGHRSWQGGRGSGYDILCSVHGGSGLFTGGAVPGWEPVSWPGDFESWVIRGPGSVGSAGAVGRYRKWKEELEEGRRPLPVLPEMSLGVKRLCSLLTSGADPAAFLEEVHELARLGASLGGLIGVPAMPKLPDAFGGGGPPWYRRGAGAAKCLGAGDETILLMALPDGLRPRERAALAELAVSGDAEPLRPEPRGLSRENES
jgi:phosphomevalonate kinase